MVIGPSNNVALMQYCRFNNFISRSLNAHVSGRFPSKINKKKKNPKKQNKKHPKHNQNPNLFKAPRYSHTYMSNKTK